jgi:MHS family proline/betaine transporter-like MFS transporter
MAWNGMATHYTERLLPSSANIFFLPEMMSLRSSQPSVFLPWAFWLSDNKEREVILKIVLILYVALAIPYIYLLEYKTFFYALVSQLAFSIILGYYISAIPTLVAELFPTKTRYTGMSLANNLAAAIFGGTAPILVTKMIALSGSNWPISFYIMVAAVVSFSCIASVRIRRHRDLLHLV